MLLRELKVIESRLDNFLNTEKFIDYWQGTITVSLYDPSDTTNKIIAINIECWGNNKCGDVPNCLDRIQSAISTDTSGRWTHGETVNVFYLALGRSDINLIDKQDAFGLVLQRQHNMERAFAKATIPNLKTTFEMYTTKERAKYNKF
jgi:hypothetical protein